MLLINVKGIVKMGKFNCEVTMGDISKQKETALKVLECIRYFDPTAIVAGGAPRDWYLGNLAKDIDIYFFFRENSTRAQVKNLLTRSLKLVSPDVKLTILGYEGLQDHGEYTLNADLIAVFEADLLGQKFQFMEMRKPTFGVVENFPLSLCQAWWLGDRVKCTKDFKRSVDSKVFYKTNELYMDGHKYLNKIRQRFPDYKYFSTKSEALEYLLELKHG